MLVKRPMVRLLLIFLFSESIGFSTTSEATRKIKSLRISDEMIHGQRVTLELVSTNSMNKDHRSDTVTGIFLTCGPNSIPGVKNYMHLFYDNKTLFGCQTMNDWPERCQPLLSEIRGEHLDHRHFVAKRVLFNPELRLRWLCPITGICPRKSEHVMLEYCHNHREVFHTR